ncbi:MAG: hypothetical protein IID03_02330 [Candidatus Dadabacteria bacterium]|nr:hypothetical protein [Candidatus Dadabacteria bacterium]
MKRLSLIMGIIFLLLYVNTAYSKPVKPIKTSPGCQKNLEMCTDDLGTCGTDLGICETDLTQANTDTWAHARPTWAPAALI